MLNRCKVSLLKSVSVKFKRMGKKNRCGEEGWEPRYGNDSRPWLLGQEPDLPLEASTTTKDAFSGDWPSGRRKEGIRRQLLKKELWDQAQKQILQEQSQPEDIEQPETTYNKTFVKEGFRVEPIKTDPELHRKYPLYLDQAVSVWRGKINSLPGATKVVHPQHEFRRNAGFTTPVDQLLYDPGDIQ